MSIYSPSLITVILSDNINNSSNLCEIYTIDTPAICKSLIILKSSFVSDSVKAAVDLISLNYELMLFYFY
ncbi:hypothetical protein [Brachyspira pilosicoli]|uniref:hypothetical protein n=1 Tax=Brachyspira pilosicoli TaxID=52584 RepID=UPI002155983A|nr:hypothetical protein [Brachyspira pilosicoli]